MTNENDVIELVHKLCSVANDARKMGVNLDSLVDDAAKKICDAADKNIALEIEMLKKSLRVYSTTVH